MPLLEAHHIMEVTPMKNETLKKLKSMNLTAFANQYLDQSNNEMEYSSLSFHERLALMVESEYASRHNNAIQRLIKNANFSIPSAFMGNIAYLPDRHLNRDLLDSLSDNEYICDCKNVIIVGATGSGKTYISNALGVNACQSGYRTKYIRLPNLFNEIAKARDEGTYEKLMRHYSRFAVLILDEFLLIEITTFQRNELLEIMETRSGTATTIFCSQYTPEGWHQLLGGGAVADSILDRIMTSSYSITIKGDTSMRQRISTLK